MQSKASKSSILQSRHVCTSWSPAGGRVSNERSLFTLESSADASCAAVSQVQTEANNRITLSESHRIASIEFSQLWRGRLSRGLLEVVEKGAGGCATGRRSRGRGCAWAGDERGTTKVTVKSRVGTKRGIDCFFFESVYTKKHRHLYVFFLIYVYIYYMHMYNMGR